MSDSIRNPQHARPGPRRFLFFSLVTITVVAGAWMLTEIYRPRGLSLPELALIAVFVPCFTWIVGSFWTAVIGFVLLRFGARGRIVAAPVLADADRPIAGHRFAVVMPVCNEEPDMVFGGMTETARSLEGIADPAEVEFFVLSDTTDDGIARQEAGRFAALTGADRGGFRFHYRRRADNTGRKVGNLREFCSKHGHRFESMVILDADSMMTGAAIRTLVAIMHRNPEIGIIQTVCTPAGSTTFFGRMIQFACRLSSEIMVAGTSFWQLGDGNYHGHNAIVRIAPFVEHCELPELPGRGNLSGQILSHDFAEAAFMRRAGWTVWDIPVSDGSYEGTPQNIIDHATRDRRWCQGNLQHSRLLLWPGLKLISRLHLAMGILAYASSTLWMLLIVLATWVTINHTHQGFDYFGPGFNLYPMWPEIRNREALSLLALTVAMLAAPKLLGLASALGDGAARRRFGNGPRLALSALTELALSTLLAPVFMVFHSRHIASILGGRNSGWRTQRRGGDAVGVGEAAGALAWHYLFAAALALCMIGVMPLWTVWYLPVLIGLLLSLPLVVATAHPGLGRRCAALGLFTSEADPATTAAGQEAARTKPVLVGPVLPTAGS